MVHLTRAVEVYREYLSVRPGDHSTKLELADCLQKLMIAQSHSGMHPLAEQSQRECQNAFESAIENLSADHSAVVQKASQLVHACIALKHNETTRADGVLALRSWDTLLRTRAADDTELLEQIATALASTEGNDSPHFQAKVLATP